jgi:hypothetical protein
MNAASAGWDMACRVVGECRFGERLDREMGDLVCLAGGGDTTSTGPKQFAYVRYDPDVSAEGLEALGLPGIDPKWVQAMDSVDHIDAIQQVGKTYAEKVVRQGHWQGFE